MPRYTFPLQANKPVRLPYPGKALQMLDLGGASAVGLVLEWSNDRQRTEDYGYVPRNFRVYERDAMFSALTLTSTIDATIDFIVSFSDAVFSVADGATVNATLDASQFPLPVAVNTMPAVEIDVTDGPVAVLIDDTVPVQVDAAIQAYAAGGDRLDVAADDTASAATALDGAGTALRVLNEADDTAIIAIGGSGVSADDDDAMAVLPGSERIFALGAATHASVKLRAGTGTVSLQVGTGV